MEDKTNSMEVDNEKEDAEMSCNSEDGKSSDDERDEDELNRKKEILLKKIQMDKTDYYAYVELIQVLSDLANLEELRNVREQFSAEYPLSPEMWLAWIEDEKKIAVSMQEKKKIIDLFERALKDYSSIDIWLEYVQFSIGLMADGNAIESVRGILERAVDKCGLHVAKGSLLWGLYRDFEKVVLISFMESNNEKDELEKVTRSQKQKIADLFRRQLSIPLLEMENTYQELHSWLDSEPDAKKFIDMEDIENKYQKALNKLSRILSFEEKLLSCEADTTLPLYQSYLEFEKNSKEDCNDPARVICLYERALIDNPLNVDLWTDYLKYISELNLVPEDRHTVCYRALRNCQGEVTFWIMYMNSIEQSRKPKNEVTDFFNKALQNAFTSSSDYRSLWLSYIYYLRRQLQPFSRNDDQWKTIVEEIREVVVMAYKNLSDCFGSEGDPECELSLWWARFEGEITKDLQQFRVIWTDILDTKHGMSSSYWLRYITMEWQYGDAKHMRRLCPRALATVTDNPKNIATLWMEYESLNGSLDSFLNCQKICNERLRQYAEERKKMNERNEEKKKKGPLKTDKKKVKELVAESSQDKPKLEQNNIQKEEPKKTTEKPKKTPTASGINRTHNSHDPAKDDRTVFISNLDYTVTEEEVINLLSSCGKIEEFRLVHNYSGQSKGYGYLVFASKESVPKALKMDRTPINQRPMFISECDPDKQSRKVGLRFNKGEEKNKLFVKGLPVTLDKEGVEKIFRPYGELKDVRIVTYRNGHSKGLAYVEFEDEVSAAHALLKTDQSEVEGKVISVAISNPPERKSNLSLIFGGSSVAGIALGARSTTDTSELGSRGRGRTQLSFIPASVLTSKKPSTSPSSATKMDTTEASSESSKKALSNADFRNMLLSKK